MTGFEPLTSGIESNRSTNCDTTTAQYHIEIWFNSNHVSLVNLVS